MRLVSLAISGICATYVPMYIERVPNRNSRPAILLREGWHEGKEVCKRTLVNLSDWPAQKVEALRRVLRDEPLAAVEDVFASERSWPHGHVEAVLETIRRIGLDKLIGTKRTRERDLVLAMIAERLIAPCSKLATKQTLQLLPAQRGDQARGRARRAVCHSHQRVQRKPLGRRYRAQLQESGAGRARLSYPQRHGPAHPPDSPSWRGARACPHLLVPARLLCPMAYALGTLLLVVRRRAPIRRAQAPRTGRPGQTFHPSQKEKRMRAKPNRGCPFTASRRSWQSLALAAGIFAE
jgi:hypothetical protein